jgi:hypothetical protein
LYYKVLDVCHAAVYSIPMQDLHPHRLRRPHSRSRPLPLRALDDLRYIRETMERSAAFTASPGWGQLLMGVTAVAAAAVASRQSTPTGWLSVWLIESAVAVAIAIPSTQLKAHRTGLALTSGPSRKFALGFLPSIAAAVVLTAALVRAHEFSLLPGVWLLLYGAAIVSAAAFSIPVLRGMGLGFLLAGALALYHPAWGNLLMATAFGGLHIVFGAWIGAKHGG